MRRSESPDSVHLLRNRHAVLEEIGLSPEKARKLGYERDDKGKDLVDSSQTIEIFPQDIVPSVKAGNYLLKVSNFLDDLLHFPVKGNLL